MRLRGQVSIMFWGVGFIYFSQDYMKTRYCRLWTDRLILLKCKIYANENSKTQFCIAVEKPKRMKRWDISCGAGCLYFKFHQKWSKLRTNIHLGLKCSPIEKNLWKVVVAAYISFMSVNLLNIFIYCLFLSALGD